MPHQPIVAGLIRRRPHAIPASGLLLGCAITLCLYVWSVHGERARGSAEFTRFAEGFRAELSVRTQTYIDILPGLKALSILEKDTDDRRFAQFVSAISLPERFPGLAFLFTADRVQGESLTSYIESVRNDRSLTPSGRPAFAVQPPGKRAEHMVIRHSSPESKGTIGYDLYDPSKSYRADVDRATTSGLPVATGPIVLARDRNTLRAPDTTSIVVRMPVYRSLDTPATIAQRRESLRGLVGVAFQTMHLVGSVLTPEMSARLQLRIIDGDAKPDASLVFDDAWLDSGTALNPAPKSDATLVLPMEVANRHWQIFYRDRQQAFTYLLRPIPLLILFLGMSSSILLALLLRTLVGKTRSAEQATREALARVKREQRALEEAQAMAAIGSWEWEIVTGRLYWSAEMVRIYGLTATAFMAQPELLYVSIPPEDRGFVRSHLLSASTDRLPFDFEHRLCRADGSIHFLHARADVQFDDAGSARAMVGTVQDITSRKQAEAAAHALQLRYRLLFENSLDGVLQTVPDGRIIAANPAACGLYGRSEAEMLALHRDDLVDSTDVRLAGLLAIRRLHGKVAGELRMKKADGTIFDSELTSSEYADESGQMVTSIVIRDDTARRQSEREVVRLAFNDGLTGLPNRRLLMDRASLALAEARRRHQLGAVLFIDLDNFKTINDAKGHATGDAMLCQVTERLKLLMRDGDTVARLGGDEFVILLTGLADTFEAAARAAMLASERVRDELCVPYLIDGRQYMSSASIGVSIFPRAEQSYSDILREADTAMYRAKSAGRNRVAFFAQSMQSEVEEQLALEHALEEAVREEQFHLVAQPQFDLSGAECGAELLLRWDTAPGGPVPPEKFIPLAEQTGLILRLGDWVIEQACKTLAALRQRGVTRTLSINVSPRQFLQSDFVERVKEKLARHHVLPSQLIFEVTENLLIKNLADAASRMRELNEIGIRFSIDDFGTGYSSLTYLKQLPLFELKIDKSFIQDAPGDPSDTAIVQLILGMAKHLRLRVVAEGVETQEQYEFLKRNNCDCLQGFLLARPVRLSQWARKQHMADESVSLSTAL